MPILDSKTVEFTSRSADQTRRLGIRLGALLQPFDVICLSGDLGSGKTTLVQGIAKGWGSTDPVTSPTFVIVNHYRRSDNGNLYHLDAYRLHSAREAEDLDIFNLMETGCLVVEWSERIRSVLPEDYLQIDLEWVSDEQRHLMFIAHGSRFESLLEEFRKRAFGG